MTIQEELEVELRKYADEHPDLILPEWIKRKIEGVNFDYSSDVCDTIAKLLGKIIELEIEHGKQRGEHIVIARIHNIKPFKFGHEISTNQPEKLPAIQVALTTLLREENEKGN